MFLYIRRTFWIAMICFLFVSQDKKQNRIFLEQLVRNFAFLNIFGKIQRILDYLFTIFNCSRPKIEWFDFFKIATQLIAFDFGIINQVGFIKISAF